MKDFIVAGILGTMLTFSKNAPVAQAHDRSAAYRIRVDNDDDDVFTRIGYGNSGYRCISYDHSAHFTRERHPSPISASSYRHRPYAATYRPDNDFHYADFHYASRYGIGNDR